MQPTAPARRAALIRVGESDVATPQCRTDRDPSRNSESIGQQSDSLSVLARPQSVGAGDIDPALRSLEVRRNTPFQAYLPAPGRLGRITLAINCSASGGFRHRRRRHLARRRRLQVLLVEPRLVHPRRAEQALGPRASNRTILAATQRSTAVNRCTLRRAFAGAGMPGSLACADAAATNSRRRPCPPPQPDGHGHRQYVPTRCRATWLGCRPGKPPCNGGRHVDQGLYQQRRHRGPSLGSAAALVALVARHRGVSQQQLADVFRLELGGASRALRLLAGSAPYPAGRPTGPMQGST